MTSVDDRIYQFGLAAQWEAGVRSNLQLRADRLTVPDELAIEPLGGGGGLEAGAMPAVDRCGQLMWLRLKSRELVRRPPPGSAGVMELGTLDGPVPARRILVGRTILWVLADDSLDRYNAPSLQRLSPVEPVRGWRASDVTSDGGDGVWLLEGGSSRRWRLRHVDCWGRSCRAPIAVSGFGAGDLAVAATRNGDWLVVIDTVSAAAVQVITAATGEVVRSIGLDVLALARFTLVTAEPRDRIHLLTILAEGDTDHGSHVVYRALNLTDGDVEDQQDLEVPPTLGRPTALVGGAAGLVVACSHGLGEIIRRQGRPAGQRHSTFITPALVSPLGQRSGWNRAEIDVALPAGTALDLTWASTESAWLVEQAANLLDGPATAGLVDKLDELLPWQDAKMVIYRGTEDDVGVEHLAALLDEVKETTLWLRIRLHTPPGRTPPALVGLRVRYPDTSYLDHLPAIYREHAPARELRQILAPFELLFDGLDEALASLPARIDPSTAGDNWTDYLLSWLGFPPLGDLPAHLRRELLVHAADILRLRGTRTGVQLLLDVVTEKKATVTDTAEEPAGWFLGRGDVPSVGASPARLGFDTLALAQRPGPARPGTMVVGETPLGQGCPDPALMLAHRASTITVTLELDREQRQNLSPIIDRLLPVFVPVHCRLQLVYTGADSADRSRQLDLDFQLGPPDSDHSPSPHDALLHSDAHWRLTATTQLGLWCLPEPAI